MLVILPFAIIICLILGIFFNCLGKISATKPIEAEIININSITINGNYYNGHTNIITTYTLTLKYIVNEVEYINKNTKSYKELDDTMKIGNKIIIKYNSKNPLELTLKESAIYEDFNKVEGCMAFWGIFLIPKNQTIENLDFYTIENSITDDYIIHKDSNGYIDNYYINYSEKLIDNNMFKNLGFIPYDDFYMKLITNESDLTSTIKDLELNKEIDILESDSKKYFSYRNILLCAKNSNGTFYCKPTVTKDFYYQDVWSTQSLKIKE